LSNYLPGGVNMKCLPQFKFLDFNFTS